MSPVYPRPYGRGISRAAPRMFFWKKRAPPRTHITVAIHPRAYARGILAHTIKKAASCLIFLLTTEYLLLTGLFGLHYLVDQAVLLGLVIGHEVVTVGVFLNLLNRFSGILRENFVEIFFRAQNMFCANRDIDR